MLWFAKLRNLVIDEARHSVKIIVDPDQLSLAIGKKGQNARSDRQADQLEH